MRAGDLVGPDAPHSRSAPRVGQHYPPHTPLCWCYVLSPMPPAGTLAPHTPYISPPRKPAAHAPTGCPHTRCHPHANQPPSHPMPLACTPATHGPMPPARTPAAHAPDITCMHTSRPGTHLPPTHSLAVFVVVSADVAEVSSKGLHRQRAGDFPAPTLDDDACEGDRSSVHPHPGCPVPGRGAGRGGELDQHRPSRASTEWWVCWRQSSATKTHRHRDNDTATGNSKGQMLPGEV